MHRTDNLALCLAENIVVCYGHRTQLVVQASYFLWKRSRPLLMT